MSSIKNKPLKKIVCDTRVTIDSLHNKNLKSIDKNNKDINDLKSKIDKLETTKRTTEDINTKIHVENEIVSLKNKLNKYNKEEYVDYYFKNGLLLSDYYNNDNKFTPVNSKNPEEKKTVLDFMMKDKPIINNKYNNIIKTYMVNTDDNYTNDSVVSNINYCKICQTKLYLKYNDGEVICEKCGFTEKVIVNIDSNSYKDPIRESTCFAYKRINHFSEWLAQFQAKETTDIPKEIYDNVFIELKKNKNYSIINVNYKSIRDILKKLDYNKYYEHIFHIIYMMTGEKTPTLDRTTEEQFRNMFKDIQQPFQKHCPPDRKNFLSYSYVLHKFCELLELKEFLECFPYLKSTEKLRQQDTIWKNICKELRWEYIPSA